LLQLGFIVLTLSSNVLAGGTKIVNDAFKFCACPNEVRELGLSVTATLGGSFESVSGVCDEFFEILYN